MFPAELINKFTKLAPEIEPYIDRIDFALVPTRESPFVYLTRAIIRQQISGKAADSIERKFREGVGDLSPQRIKSIPVDTMRSFGLSRQKASYMQNLAEAFCGTLHKYTTAKSMDNLSDPEIIELLTSIKGIGEWTAQMYLIFSLGRHNILAHGDLGVQKGVQKLFGLEQLPKPREVKKLCAHWDGYATLGTWIAWRVLDL